MGLWLSLLSCVLQEGLVPYKRRCYGRDQCCCHPVPDRPCCRYWYWCNPGRQTGIHKG